MSVSMKSTPILLLLLIGGCAGSASLDKSPVVAIIGTQSVTLNDLGAQFDRNTYRNDSLLDRATALREFLPLYTDYRVKLLAAERSGYLQDAELLAELEQYERQTAYPYWMENRIKDQLLDEFMRRSTEEIGASHILISVQSNATPADTLRVWNRLLEARSKALAGGDFDSLSTIYSSMQQGRSMGGDLGYFSAGWAVREFENVAYATRVGEISMPFRTQFGYHIIHVKDRRPATPDRLVSHIYFVSSPDSNAIAEAMSRANVVYARMKSGEDFATLAMEFSEDGQSAPTGGQIGWIGSGRYLPTFTDPVMAAPADGTPTAPFYSGYGVHIIRIDSVRSYPTVEAERAEKLDRLRQLPHFRDSKAATIAQVRRTSRETVNQDAIRQLETLLSSNRDRGLSAAGISEALRSQTLYTLRGTRHTVQDFLNWLPAHMDTSNTGTYSYTLRESFFNDRADAQLIDITRKEFPAFADLSRNYLHGLAIFKISEDSVWNYAKNDTVAVRALYEANRSDYRFETRHLYVRFTANSDSVLLAAKAHVEAGIPTDSVRTLVRGLLVRGDQATTLDGEPQNRLAGVAPGGFSPIFDYRGRPTMLYLERIEEARDMTFEEAYFRVVTNYQPIRERTWLDRLRTEFGVREYPDRIR